jgi:hypothetical protein
MKADARGPRIAARSFFRQLRTQGYDRNQIINVLSELMELVIDSIQGEKRQPSQEGTPADGTATP